MKKVMIILAMALLLLLPSVFAEQIYGYNETIDLKVSCSNNETYCSGNTKCNLTTIYPNSTILVNNGGMTNNLAYFNYTLNYSDVDQVGNYQNYVYCEDLGYMDFTTFAFTVTKSGQETSTAQGLTYILIILGLLGAAAMFIIIAAKLDNEYMMIKMLFIIIAMFMIMAMISSTQIFLDVEQYNIGTENYDRISGHITAGYKGAWIVTWASTIFFMVLLVTKALIFLVSNIKKKKRGRER